MKLEVTNRIAGVVRLDWSGLYSGTEADYMYSVTMPGDGSLIRVRLTPPEEGCKLYRQRIAVPYPSSDFSQWEYTGQYGVLAVGCCSQNTEIFLVWIDASRRIMHAKSTDYGITWGIPELIDYTPSTAVYGLALAYKSDGDLAVFLIDQSDLYVKKYTGGIWQNILVWDKTTGELSGVACIYDRDWDLLVTGKDADGNFKLWSLVYGDGDDVTAGDWSPLKEMASAPSGSDFEFRNPCLDKPDVFRCFYIEKFTGVEAYSRPFWSHSVPGTPFLDGLWHEPVPFKFPGGYSLGLTHYDNYVWLSCASGVWRALLAPQTLDLSGDIIGLKEELDETSGKLTVSLRNDTGRYASPGIGQMAVLNNGCQVEFGPGYRTVTGSEISTGQTFVLEAYEHVTGGGKSILLLYALNGWEALRNWQARYQFRWNKGAAEMNVKQVLESILARVGIKLEIKSQSTMINDFYPDFTVHTGNSGEAVISRLLTFVPDFIFIEGNTAYLINPQPSDSPLYGYGTGHSILEGKHRKSAMAVNRIQTEGHDDDNNG